LQIHPIAAALFQLALLAQQTPPQTVTLVNPTNIDIDSPGRIRVIEAVNYRRQLKGEKITATPAGAS
jgi:hypothetical protein